MGSIRFQISDELESRFRERAMRRFGYGRGSLSRAAEEAILRWLISLEGQEVGFEGDPVEAIDGLLKDVDLDSVELQHLAKDLWTKRELEDVPS
ncbi:MAG: hypothetical protein ACE5KH_03980 [Candidatus Geothermarchaeales archaeon]